jgi:hypothetical protein
MAQGYLVRYTEVAQPAPVRLLRPRVPFHVPDQPAASAVTAIAAPFFTRPSPRPVAGIFHSDLWVHTIYSRFPRTKRAERIFSGRFGVISEQTLAFVCQFALLLEKVACFPRFAGCIDHDKQRLLTRFADICVQGVVVRHKRYAFAVYERIVLATEPTRLNVIVLVDDPAFLFFRHMRWSPAMPDDAPEGLAEIVQNRTPALRKEADPVIPEDIRSENIHKVFADMKQALDAQEDGAAIAAPQIDLTPWARSLAGDPRPPRGADGGASESTRGESRR